MTGAAKGFLMLSSHLGDPTRHPLTTAQLRFLAERMRIASAPIGDGELTMSYLSAIGLSKELSQRILHLLKDEAQFRAYVSAAGKAGCIPITRSEEAYPIILRKRLGEDSPGCLWMKGNPAILSEPTISLVGSRNLNRDNWEFAREVGRQAALQGFALVSGNARGADRAAQDACLEAGGSVISVIADSLCEQPIHGRILYISEDGYNEPFSSMRALQRNRIIHCLGWFTMVAQCTYGKGGTWDGTWKNLQHNWSPVWCFRDGSPAFSEFAQMGAESADLKTLQDLGALIESTNTLFDL